MSSKQPTNLPPFGKPVSSLFGEVAEKWEQMRKAVEPVEPLRENVGKTPDRFALLAERVRLLSDSSATYKRLARLPRLSEVPELRDNVEAQLDMLANTISHLQEVPSDCIDWVVHYSHYDDSNYNVISQCAAEIHYQSGLLMSQLEDTFSGYKDQLRSLTFQHRVEERDRTWDQLRRSLGNVFSKAIRDLREELFPHGPAGPTELTDLRGLLCTTRSSLTHFGSSKFVEASNALKAQESIIRGLWPASIKHRIRSDRRPNCKTLNSVLDSTLVSIQREALEPDPDQGVDLVDASGLRKILEEAGKELAVLPTKTWWTQDYLDSVVSDARRILELTRADDELGASFRKLESSLGKREEVCTEDDVGEDDGADNQLNSWKEAVAFFRVAMQEPVWNFEQTVDDLNLTVHPSTRHGVEDALHALKAYVRSFSPSTSARKGSSDPLQASRPTKDPCSVILSAFESALPAFTQAFEHHLMTQEKCSQARSRMLEAFASWRPSSIDLQDRSDEASAKTS